VFYRERRVITEDAALTAARLLLVDATRRVLRNTLDLMGVAAVERM
jgi:arginyl-tRNA synthetase